MLSVPDHPVLLQEASVQSCFDYPESMFHDRRFSSAISLAPDCPILVGPICGCNDVSNGEQLGFNSYYLGSVWPDHPIPSIGSSDALNFLGKWLARLWSDL
jgi:hypothetical protein